MRMGKQWELRLLLLYRQTINRMCHSEPQRRPMRRSEESPGKKRLLIACV